MGQGCSCASEKKIVCSVAESNSFRIPEKRPRPSNPISAPTSEDRNSQGNVRHAVIEERTLRHQGSDRSISLTTPTTSSPITPRRRSSNKRQRVNSAVTESTVTYGTFTPSSSSSAQTKSKHLNDNVLPPPFAPPVASRTSTSSTVTCGSSAGVERKPEETAAAASPSWHRHRKSFNQITCLQSCGGCFRCCVFPFDSASPESCDRSIMFDNDGLNDITNFSELLEQLENDVSPKAKMVEETPQEDFALPEVLSSIDVPLLDPQSEEADTDETWSMLSGFNNRTSM